MDFELINDSVQNIARKYFKSSHIELEDLEQELWLHLLERGIEEKPISYIRVALINKCKRIYFENKKENEICSAFVEEGELGDKFLFEEFDFSFDDDTYQFVENKKDFEMLLSLLNPKERVFVVVKGYISYDLLYLKEEYEKYVKNVSEDDLRLLIKSNCNNYHFNRIFFGNANRTGGTLQYTKKTLRKKIKKVGLAS